jgi:hypothetical protein
MEVRVRPDKFDKLQFVARGTEFEDIDKLKFVGRFKGDSKNEG